MKVAVVGSGVSGLAATWLLNEHSEHEVHLYEADSRPGGHANTVEFIPPGSGLSPGEGVFVDSGFIVMNPSTYPNFLRFLGYAPNKSSWLGRLFGLRPDQSNEGITIVPTEMTFSVTRDGGAFEWAGKNLFTVFCQPRRILDSRMWRMIYDVLRFNACAYRFLLKEDYSVNGSIGEYLQKHNYSDFFRNNYLIPMTAAIWSTPPGKCFEDFPAKTLIQFMYNHHLLQITGKPSWLTIQGGSHHYVKRILAELPKHQLHLNTPVVAVTTRDNDSSVVLKTQAGAEVDFDHVIFACHSDTALEILKSGNVTPEEERILGSFSWNRNEVILHSDARMMPKSKSAWSCWNYLTTGKKDDKISLTYGMNDLQHIPEEKWGPVLCTLNPPFEADSDKVVGRWKYDHPVLDASAVQAQNEMPKIQNQRGITYAGAYLKYGFHEDGFTSGMLAACAIDEERGSFPRFSPERQGRESNSMAIPVRAKTVKPPFDIQYADHHLALRRQGRWTVQYAVALLFDIFEWTGLRGLLGVVGGAVLCAFSMLLGLSHAE